MFHAFWGCKLSLNIREHQLSQMFLESLLHIPEFYTRKFFCHLFLLNNIYRYLNNDMECNVKQNKQTKNPKTKQKPFIVSTYTKTSSANSCILGD